jgi:hypothetical protein
MQIVVELHLWVVLVCLVDSAKEADNGPRVQPQPADQVTLVEDLQRYQGLTI